MSPDRLNDLLQEWAASRIKSSSKVGRAERLRKILDKISEKQPKAEKPSPARSRGPTSDFGPPRKGPQSAGLPYGDEDELRRRRGKFG